MCAVSAAVKYEVPANIVLAVAEKEGGKPGQWVRNTNATYDIGSMQFNTAYIRTLARYGIGAETPHIAPPQNEIAKLLAKGGVEVGCHVCHRSIA